MIVYASRTGNVRYIASKLNANPIEISEELMLNKPYLLITYTDGLGDIPVKVARFFRTKC
ncbi:MAG: class Ib ribonucleoside-diphosphate reductase assembly flavoprotein NrdI [Bacillaceae bacterium]|nr:class Ib ribonucleoside-diphosphate reductase assembly flavoprotein NrdI [Bacillaceae bacterium]